VERSIGYIRRSFYVPLISRYKQLGEPLDLDTVEPGVCPLAGGDR